MIFFFYQGYFLFCFSLSVLSLGRLVVQDMKYSTSIKEVKGQLHFILAPGCSEVIPVFNKKNTRAIDECKKSNRWKRMLTHPELLINE